MEAAFFFLPQPMWVSVPDGQQTTMQMGYVDAPFAGVAPTGIVYGMKRVVETNYLPSALPSLKVYKL